MSRNKTQLSPARDGGFFMPFPRGIEIQGTCNSVRILLSMRQRFEPRPIDNNRYDVVILDADN